MESELRNDSTLRFSAGMTAFLDSGLPLPPLPLEAMPRMMRLHDSFFATDSRPIPPFCADFSTLDELFAAGAGSISGEENSDSNEGPDISYFALGVVGYGLQSTNFLYLLAAKNVQFCISLPWNRIYADAEQEFRTLDEAFQLARTCQLYRSSHQQLSVILDRDGCRWMLREKVEVIREEEGVSELLDVLQSFDTNPDTLPQIYWLRV